MHVKTCLPCIIVQPSVDDLSLKGLLNHPHCQDLTTGEVSTGYLNFN